MSVDSKAAKHICNVIRRQVEQAYPDLFIYYLVHEEDKRAEEFVKDYSSFHGSKAIETFQTYFENIEHAHLLSTNRSDFLALAHYTTPSFLGLLQKENTFAICAINYNRFSSEHALRNHAYNLAWHAIDLYHDIKNDRAPAPSKNIDKIKIFNRDHVSENIAKHNLCGDIFSASAQFFNGKKNLPLEFCRQRMNSTMTNEVGFLAEDYPFPIAIDTLTNILRDDEKIFSKLKDPIKAAVQLTKRFEKTLNDSTLSQWKDFSIPCQRLAWAHYPKETILGAALFTSENTHTQNIADIVSDKLDIKPETITTLSFENPFGANETNKALHTKLCQANISKAFSAVYSTDNYTVMLKTALQQCEDFAQGKTAGWCVPSLIEAAHVLQTAAPDESLESSKERALAKAEESLQSISWEILNEFSELVFKARRLQGELSLEEIRQLAAKSDKFLGIYSALSSFETKQQEIKNSADSGIMQFVSPKTLNT